jgi:cellobiose dehydrogenase (acceptor)
MDGKMYYQEGFNALATALQSGGWKRLDEPNAHYTEKNHTFGHTTYMFSGGERGGPLATYLVSAAERRSFTLWTNTNVKRVTRVGGHITGVEVEVNGDGGHCGTVKVTQSTGRVIVSAGTFGSAKLLLRSKSSRILSMTKQARMLTLYRRYRTCRPARSRQELR